MRDKAVIGLTFIILAMIGCYGLSLQKEKPVEQARLQQYLECHQRTLTAYRRDI